ncbi:MAG: pyruvate carboxylase [Flavobacteriales bacterium]|nr:pyruvate carboxylase [Flavobacteriales bacterium]
MKIKSVLVANRGEIAIRVFRACVEINVRTIGVYTHEDRYSMHRYKCDESYQIGEDDAPLKPYLDIDELIRVAKQVKADAIHPGYGFLSENSEFARKCAENGIIFIGPSPEVIDALGDKINAKETAIKNNVPVIQSNEISLTTSDIALTESEKIGFPVMLKAASGGGGRGMRVIRKAEEIKNYFDEARREAKNAFGDDTMFLEKYVENPKHIEIQIVADQHGNTVHLFERDCSVQRRFQKVVEVAPSFGLSEDVKEQLYVHAVNICTAVGYNNVGTVEFLVDANDGVYFIEVNPRIQVEHTVTEMVTGIDLIKTQIFIAAGFELSSEQIKIPNQESVSLDGYALQCRITTEDPRDNFKPDYGTIITYRSAGGFGIRLDMGSLYAGVKISPFFDSMLVKVSAQSRTLDGACRKMERALKEFQIRGVNHNIQFLQNIVSHETFRNGQATVGFIDQAKELFKFNYKLDRATKIVRYLGDIVVNGNPDVKFIDTEKKFITPVIPDFDKYAAYPKGTKDLLTELGPEKFAEKIKNDKQIHYTDTTFRDAHQSLLATRMRSYDLNAVAEAFAKNHPDVFSMEVWGGATFDVCLRFLHENPWKRLAELRERMPNVLLQMLIRGSNGVGYSAYPDNLVERFVEESWNSGVDVFRVFDSLNWMENMEPCIKFVREKTQGIAEGTLCYTGNILDGKKTKYDIKYYQTLAKQLEDAGSHILCIKDMAGLLKPLAATELIHALKDTVNIPIHLHTHDTSSLQTTTYLKAIDAGVDIIDVALGGLSGLTSQPNFNAVVEMMEGHERHREFDLPSLNQHSNYWESIREYYYPFESGLKASTAEVFNHEIPGGQYSNLRPQSIALGLSDKFDRVKEAYAEVNEMFGDVVKVTPSSKVVGDMAIYMTANNLTKEDIFERGDTLSFPESVIEFFRGDLGQPVGGFPKELQKIILRDIKPYTTRPNANLTPVDFDGEFETFLKEFQPKFDRELLITDFLSYKLYPKVYKDAWEKHQLYGDISRIPTKNFFYGMEPNEEVIIEIAEGKKIIVKLLSIGPADEDGIRTCFFKINGQTRNIDTLDRSMSVIKVENMKADPENEQHIGSPLQGLLSKILVKKGDVLKKNDPLFVIEAMKMESTIAAPADGSIKATILKEGTMVDTDDLVVTIE